MVAKRDGEPHRHRHVPEPPTFRHRDVTLPLRALHAELPFLQIHVTPFEGHHFTAPKPRVSAQQHDQVRVRATRPGSGLALFIPLQI